MNKIQQKVASTTNFVKKHRVALTAIVAGTTGVVIGYKTNGNVVEMHKQFLRDNNLLEAFYTTLEEEI